MREIEGGFPHSEILGSKLVRSSPRLIAAYHVLHRLSAPRHPPDALTTLDYSHDPCPLGSAQDRQRKTCLFGYLQKTCFACQAYPAQRLRAVAGSQDLGVPLAEYAASLRFQTSAPPNPRRAGREPRLTCQTSTSAALRARPSKSDGGACRDRTDDLKLAKL